MKTKIFMYDRSGNKVITRYMELSPLAENIYVTLVQKDFFNVSSNDIFGVVSAIRGIYFIMKYCSRMDIADINYKNRLIDCRNKWIDSIKRSAEENQYIRLLEIRVFEALGEDTTILQRARETVLQKRAIEQTERQRREQEAIQEKKRREQTQLDECKRRFLAGETISGDDFINITNRDRFIIHIRTKGTFRKRITKMNRNSELWYSKIRGKKAPDATGCFKAIKNYLTFLQNEIQT